MDVKDNLKEFLGILKSSTTIRKFYRRLPDDQVMDSDYSPQDFQVDQGYFQIKLSEMFLHDRREYWRKFLPVGLVLSDFFFQKRETVPFLVGHHLLQDLEKTVKGQSVEYHNTQVAGPIPYRGGGLALFVGLCRVQVSDLVEELFSCLESLVKTLDVPPFSSYLTVAQPLYHGLKGLMGQSEVELRFGHRDNFTDQDGDLQRFRSGYLAFINCPEDAIPVQDLWVKDGRLQKGTRENHEHLTDYDYCLVKIEHLAERQDYESLPFFALWGEVKKILWSGAQALATSKLNDFLAQLALAPDLVTPHRHQLIQVFKANFDKEVEAYQIVKGIKPEAAPTVTRGPKGILGPVAALQKTASLAKKAKFSPETITSIKDISSNWHDIPHLGEVSKSFQLTSEIINQQMQTFKERSPVAQPDPVALANAIAVATMSATEK